MDHREFLNRFNVEYDNIMSNAAPGLNGYEISIFLTKGQDEILKNYFNPLGNKYKEGFDGSPKRQIDFSKIIKTEELRQDNAPLSKLDDRSKIFNMPSDVMFILNENLYSPSNKIIQAIPISFQDYQRLMRKAYKYPHKSGAWRLISQVSSNIPQIEIITPEEVNKYIMRYVRVVKPIIVEDLTPYGVTINGISTVNECEVDEILHEEILQRAVELAKAAYTGNLETSVKLGERSE